METIHPTLRVFIISPQIDFFFNLAMDKKKGFNSNNEA